MSVAWCDRQGTIVEMNPALERALGRTSGDASPLRLWDLVAPEEREQTASLVQQLIDAKRDSLRLEATGVGQDPRSMEWTVWLIPDPGDGAGSSLLMVEDPQERHAGDWWHQRQRWEAVGRLAGGVFHDFNNLLTGMMLYCDLLLQGLESGNGLRRYAEEIRSAILQATGLVRQLLVVVRQGKASPRLLSVNDVATGMQNLLTRLIGENIDIQFHLATDLGLVKVDLAQAQQILLNLVLNARDALPEGGGITVETSNCKFQSLTGASLPSSCENTFPFILLVVADNGHGMDAETRQSLFEPFFTTKVPGKGNGLGLTTVHNIVSRAGGLIHVDSEPGRGTRMMILLPRENESAGGTRELPSQDPQISTSTPLQVNAKELTL